MVAGGGEWLAAAAASSLAAVDDCPLTHGGGFISGEIFGEKGKNSESRCVRLSGLPGCRPVVVRACPVPVSGCPVGRDTTGQPDRPPKNSGQKKLTAPSLLSSQPKNKNLF